MRRRGVVISYRTPDYHLRPGMTIATCWCERCFVEIPVADVGTSTASCGHPECHP